MAATRTLKLTIAYDGTNYVGWQRQINGLSIQQVIEEALQPLVTGARPPAIIGAGRTDAGVHALEQVASVRVACDIPPGTIHRALNVRLPPDIRVLDVADAAPEFHAQFHARGKVYRYRMATARILPPFDRWFVWHAPGRRDVDAMRAAAATLLGRHDFASFQTTGSPQPDTIRSVDRLDITERPGEIVIEVEGDGFLRHMVRAIVGTLAEVGTGTRRPDSIAGTIAAHDRQAAGPTVPARGLTLVRVRY